MSTLTAISPNGTASFRTKLANLLPEPIPTASVTFKGTATSNRFLEESPRQDSHATPSQSWSFRAAQSTSPLRKGGAFAVVILVHALVIYALSFVTPKLAEEKSVPLQVVTIEAPKNSRDVAVAPPPIIQIADVHLPTEPVIDVAVEESKAISVVARVSDATTSDAATTSEPKVVSAVEYIREPVAKYPSAARALKQRGTVLLRAKIDASGHALEVNVQRSSGYRLLDDTAREAVLKALFKPYMENGRSIPVFVVIPIEFGASS